MSWYWPLLCHSTWPCTVLITAFTTVFNIFYKSWLCVYYCRWVSSTVFDCGSLLFHDWLVRIEKYIFFMPWASWNRQKCPKIVLKFNKNLVLKFHFLLLGPLITFVSASFVEWLAYGPASTATPWIWCWLIQVILEKEAVSCLSVVNIFSEMAFIHSACNHLHSKYSLVLLYADPSKGITIRSRHRPGDIWA